MTVTYYIINSIRVLSLVICEKALNIKRVNTKLLRPAMLLTAFTTIYKHIFWCYKALLLNNLKDTA
jgi:uncharacterized protein (UPF0332 family)